MKSFVTGRFALNLETSDAVIRSLVTLDVYDLPENSLETYRARVAASEHPARVQTSMQAAAVRLCACREGLVSYCRACRPHVCRCMCAFACLERQSRVQTSVQACAAAVRATTIVAFFPVYWGSILAA